MIREYSVAQLTTNDFACNYFSKELQAIVNASDTARGKKNCVKY